MSYRDRMAPQLTEYAAPRTKKLFRIWACFHARRRTKFEAHAARASELSNGLLLCLSPAVRSCQPLETSEGIGTLAPVEIVQFISAPSSQFSPGVHSMSTSPGNHCATRYRRHRFAQNSLPSQCRNANHVKNAR